jgi:hypothetical protein
VTPYCVLDVFCARSVLTLWTRGLAAWERYGHWANVRKISGPGGNEYLFGSYKIVTLFICVSELQKPPC